MSTGKGGEQQDPGFDPAFIWHDDETIKDPAASVRDAAQKEGLGVAEDPGGDDPGEVFCMAAQSPYLRSRILSCISVNTQLQTVQQRVTSIVIRKQRQGLQWLNNNALLSCKCV